MAIEQRKLHFSLGHLWKRWRSLKIEIWCDKLFTRAFYCCYWCRDLLLSSFFHYLAIIVGPTHFKAMDRDDNILSDFLIDSCLCWKVRRVLLNFTLFVSNILNKASSPINLYFATTDISTNFYVFRKLKKKSENWKKFSSASGVKL